MKIKPTLITAALAAAFTSMTAHSADLTPAETKAIAEEGFIYGLPIVMNYAVMYEYAVDKNSGQFKAPFNQIKNEARVFTYKDTAVVTPNSDTPYSFAWLDLRAEPIVFPSRRWRKERYYSVMLCDGNTFNYGYIGSRATGNEAGDYMVVGPDWKGETPAGHQEGVPFHHAVLGRGLPHPALQPGRHAERGQGSVRLQSAAALGLPQATRAAGSAGHQLPEDQQGTGEDRTSLSISTLPCNSLPPGRRKKKSGRSWPASASGGKELLLQGLSPEQKAAVVEGMKEGEAKVDAVSPSRQEEHQRLEDRRRSSATALSSTATG